MSRGDLFAGTSGFAYKEWKGVFYPEGIPDREMLTHYSRMLPSVEINYTFRRMPAETTLTNWNEQASDGFTFTLKAPQRITHFKRLTDVREDVEEFVRRARLLGEKLGTILFQLPPNSVFDRTRLESFLAALPPAVRYAMEFRHPSWSEAADLLRGAGVALCGADTEKSPIESVPITAGHAYLRLRRPEYSEEEVAIWGKRISSALEEGLDVYCYFKHEGGGVGPRLAQALRESIQ